MNRLFIKMKILILKNSSVWFNIDCPEGTCDLNGVELALMKGDFHGMAKIIPAKTNLGS